MFRTQMPVLREERDLEKGNKAAILRSYYELLAFIAWGVLRGLTNPQAKLSAVSKRGRHILNARRPDLLQCGDYHGVVK